MDTYNQQLVDSFVDSMAESIRVYSNSRLSEDEIQRLATDTVAKLDFSNKWQMHKGIGYFARKAVDNYLA